MKKGFIFLCLQDICDKVTAFSHEVYKQLMRVIALRPTIVEVAAYQKELKLLR